MLRNACIVCLIHAYICAYVTLINEAPGKNRYKRESKGEDARSVKERRKRTREGRGGEEQEQYYMCRFKENILL